MSRLGHLIEQRKYSSTQFEFFYHFESCFQGCIFGNQSTGPVEETDGNSECKNRQSHPGPSHEGIDKNPEGHGISGLPIFRREDQVKIFPKRSSDAHLSQRLRLGRVKAFCRIEELKPFPVQVQYLYFGGTVNCIFYRNFTYSSENQLIGSNRLCLILGQRQVSLEAEKLTCYTKKDQNCSEVNQHSPIASQVSSDDHEQGNRR